MNFRAAAIAAGLVPLQGKEAIKRQHRQQVRVGSGARAVGSVDIDTHFQRTEPNANRWDYVVGFKRGKEFVIWIEAHPASSQRDVDTVIKKFEWLKYKLAEEGFHAMSVLTGLAPAESRYCWLYRGSCRFRTGGQEQRRLAKCGMGLPKRFLEI